MSAIVTNVPFNGGAGESDRSKFMLSERMYKVTKQLVQVILPATASAYFGLASIWGLPGAEKVVGTIAVITTFLGVTMGISAKNYKASGMGIDGTLVPKSQPNGKLLFDFQLQSDPMDLLEKDSVTFNVAHPDDEDPGLEEAFAT